MNCELIYSFGYFMGVNRGFLLTSAIFSITFNITIVSIYHVIKYPVKSPPETYSYSS